MTKDPGPEDPPLVHPCKGVLCDLADFNIILEYWSTGVLDSRRPDKHPLGMKTKINGISATWALKILDHYPQYSITPLLQHSLDLFEAEPIISELAQRTRFSMFE